MTCVVIRCGDVRSEGAGQARARFLDGDVLGLLVIAPALGGDRAPRRPCATSFVAPGVAVSRRKLRQPLVLRISPTYSLRDRQGPSQPQAAGLGNRRLSARAKTVFGSLTSTVNLVTRRLVHLPRQRPRRCASTRARAQVEDGGSRRIARVFRLRPAPLRARFRFAKSEVYRGLVS